ncbi:MAG: AraC family ligand binding domain-containing protein [Bacteroidota bacterium]
MEGKQFEFYQIDYRANEKGFTSEPHTHPHYEIFFLEKGEASHFIDFEEYPIVDHWRKIPGK